MTSCIEIKEIHFIQGFTSKNNSHQQLGHILSATYTASLKDELLPVLGFFLKSLIVLIDTKRHRTGTTVTSMLGIPC